MENLENLSGKFVRVEFKRGEIRYGTLFAEPHSKGKKYIIKPKVGRVIWFARDDVKDVREMTSHDVALRIHVFESVEEWLSGMGMTAETLSDIVSNNPSPRQAWKALRKAGNKKH